MPRKAQWPPRINHHRQTGQARVWLDNRWRYLGAYGSPGAMDAYARLIKERAGRPGNSPVVKPPDTAPTNPGPHAPTVAEVVSAWLDQEAPRYPATSREPRAYRVALSCVLRLFGALPAPSFDAGCLGRVQSALASGDWLTPKERRARPASQRGGMVATVANRMVVRVRTVWRWAEVRGLVPPGSHAHLASLPGLRHTDARVRHSTTPGAADFATVKAVVRQLAPVGQAMLLLQWWSGMRSGEVRTMKAGQVDTSGDVWLYRLSSHKNAWRGQQRVVALGPKCKAVLAPWLEGLKPGDYVFPPTRPRADCRRPGRGCYSTETYARMVARAAERAGHKGFHPYQCRRAAAERITRVAGIEAARQVLGQKSINTTTIYAREDARHAAETARRLA